MESKHLAKVKIMETKLTKKEISAAMKQHLDKIRHLGHKKLREKGHYETMNKRRWEGHIKKEKVEA